MKHTEFNVERMLPYSTDAPIIEVTSLEITPEEFDNVVNFVLGEISLQTTPNMSTREHKEVGQIVGTLLALIKCNLFCIPEREDI